MLPHPTKLLRRLIVLSLAAYLLPVLPLSAEDKLFTQKPAIMPAHTAGEPAPSVSKESPARPDPAKKGPTPLWIWGEDIHKSYVLRKSFPGGSIKARLIATCDNRMKLSINDKEIASSDNWLAPVEMDVQKYLKPDDNVLSAEVTNEDGPAGFVLRLVLTMPDKKTRTIVSDGTWRASDKSDPKMSSAAHIVGKMGDGPWSDVFAAAGPAIASGAFNVLPGFQVERLFTVPRGSLGSWVSITFDNKGRLIASDEAGKGLCRITPPPLGSSDDVRVEHLDVKITAAQGLLWAFDSLYVMVNGGPGSGLYRARDTNGDDRLDEVVKLRPLAGGGEHGPHAVRRAPDGRSLFFIGGNFTDLPPMLDNSRVPRNWSEDLLLPRQWDGNGFARGRLAPGGWIASTDAEGKTFDVFRAYPDNP